MLVVFESTVVWQVFPLGMELTVATTDAGGVPNHGD
jgi:hypothetical protein